RLRRRDADDRELAQGAPHALECHDARLSPHDELRDERVVMQCDLVALLDPAIPADTWPAGHAEVAHHARRGEKVVDRVLRRDATLDGVAPRLQRATPSSVAS